VGKLADRYHEFHFREIEKCVCVFIKKSLRGLCRVCAGVTDNRGYFVCDSRHAYAVR